MPLYISIAPTIEKWASTNALLMFESFAEQEARFCYVSSARGECFQISIDPPEGDTVEVHAWTIETSDDREMERHWKVPIFQLNDRLEVVLSTVRGWIAA